MRLSLTKPGKAFVCSYSKSKLGLATLCLKNGVLCFSASLLKTDHIYACLTAGIMLVIMRRERDAPPPTPPAKFIKKNVF